METLLKAKQIDGLVNNHTSNKPEDYIGLLNQISSQLEGCLRNLGSYVDIKSVEHFDTYSGIAEHAHIKFTIERLEQPGNSLLADSSSTNIDDYEFTELTHEKIDRHE